MRTSQTLLVCLAFLASGISVSAQAATTPPTFGQRLFVQFGGGTGLGAKWNSERGPFAAGALAFGLRGRGVNVRLDARAFNTPGEPLLAFGVAAGISKHPLNWPHLYLLGAAGFGLFTEEGDPANHIGAVLGLVAGRRPGFLVELRYDYLLSDFTYYSSRNHHLFSAVVGLRLGALGPDSTF